MQDYENDALNNLKKILINKWDFVTMQAEEQVKPLILPKPKPFRKIKVCVTYKKNGWISYFNANHARKGVVFWDNILSWQRFCTIGGHDGRDLCLVWPMV